VGTDPPNFEEVTMQQFLVDFSKRSDCLYMYNEYIVGTINDVCMDMYVLRSKLASYDNKSQYAFKQRVDMLHNAKDQLFEVLTMTGHRNVLDFIFSVLKSESVENSDRYFDMVLELLRGVFRDLCDPNSTSSNDFKTELEKKWDVMKKSISARAEYYFIKTTEDMIKYGV